jgi:hypothetical protein
MFELAELLNVIKQVQKLILNTNLTNEKKILIDCLELLNLLKLSCESNSIIRCDSPCPCGCNHKP